jgi:hypothetical protein
LGNGIQDDPEGNDVVNFFKGQVLVEHFLVNAVKMLVASVDLGVQTVLVQFFLNVALNGFHIVFPVLFVFVHPAMNIFVGLGIQKLKGSVFQFVLDPVDAQPGSDGCINVQGFPGDLLLFGGAFVKLKGSHVMEAIGQLDEDDPDVVGHGEDHLPDALGVALMGAVGFDRGQLGHTRDDMGDIRTEYITDFRDGGVGVLHDVVEEARRDGDGIQVHIRQDCRDLQGMGEIGLSRKADLAVVDPGGIDICAVDEIDIRIRVGFDHFVNDVADTNHDVCLPRIVC